MMNVGKLVKSVARTAKDNPELALMLAVIVAPKLARKVAPVVVAVARR